MGQDDEAYRRVLLLRLLEDELDGDVGALEWQQYTRRHLKCGRRRLPEALGYVRLLFVGAEPFSLFHTG